MTEAYVGIDVSFSKTKRLSVCVCTRQECRLIPLPLKNHSPRPPKGGGNREALKSDAVYDFVQQALTYLKKVEQTLDVSIRRVAIDAPSAPRKPNICRRGAERSMDQKNINCFATPSRAEFEEIKSRASQHLSEGGSEARIPHANQLWMLAGFALFEALEDEYECIEVYPQATVALLGIAEVHKSKHEGLKGQLTGTAKKTGWPDGDPIPQLEKIGYGRLDDKLDSYLSSWVASLPEDQRKPCGEAPDDVIWVPRIQNSSEKQFHTCS